MCKIEKNHTKNTFINDARKMKKKWNDNDLNEDCSRINELL